MSSEEWLTVAEAAQRFNLDADDVRDIAVNVARISSRLDPMARPMASFTEALQVDAVSLQSYLEQDAKKRLGASCPACGGLGTVPEANPLAPSGVVDKDCDRCGGTGAL